MSLSMPGCPSRLVLLAVQGCPRREVCAGARLQGTGEGVQGLCWLPSHFLSNAKARHRPSTGLNIPLNMGCFHLDIVHL